ncbi:sensor histidine kinase [Gilvibacter sediminis]|uniref:sensor histidine kinase n=1 Tax=Gilvibacter sediminis TaxID=379071 RepID=UPI00234FC59C|nr:PAS domain-containing sensor histidine kinase [Gilvibacter sediminis]MDC7998049.1 ATP-binding protein [Gilvibacter sediminis]
MDHYLKEELYDLVKNDPRIFDFIQKGSLDGIWFWDLENPEEEWMSSKFWTELGYDPATMPHKASAWRDIINQDDLKVAGEMLKRHFANPEVPYDQIVRYTHKDGSIVYIRCRGMAIQDETGKPIRMLGAHNNLTSAIEYTSAREMTQRLADLNIALENKNKELEQFTYITSHDLQEPLNSILSFSGLLESEVESSDELVNQCISVIRGSALRMKDFIASLLEYSRIGRVKERQNVDIPALIEDLKKDLNDIIEKPNASVDYIGKPLSIQAYKIDLKRLFKNLIHNGIKYTSPGTQPKVTIDVSEDEAHYTFSIRDNGIGIPEAQFENIFEVFKRLHNRDDYPGTGIGLSHAKKVVELHGGKIWVTSELGKGSTFYFTILK